MSFSYSNDPSESRRDALRFYIRDTHAKEYLLEDEELDWIIAQNGNENKQLAIAFRQAATTLALRPDKRKLGPQEESASKRLEYYNAQALKHERDLNYIATPPTPEYQADAVFEKGMMENA